MRKHTRKKYREGQYDYRGILCERVPAGTTKYGNPRYAWRATVERAFDVVITIEAEHLGTLERNINRCLGE